MMLVDEKGLHNIITPAVAMTAVGIDKDKNSQQAVKWAVDHLLVNSQNLVLIHVYNKNTAPSVGFTFSESGADHFETEIEELFVPYRGFCARRSINVKEVILEDTDVAKAIMDYISANNIRNIVVGASSRNMFVKRFRQPDVPTTLMKNAPDFCTVYIVSRSKLVTLRSAKCPLPSKAATVNQQLPADDAVKTPFTRGGRKSPAASTPPLVPVQKSLGRGCREFEDDRRCRSNDANEYHNYSGESHGSALPDHNARRDLEAEMRKLKLELKQTTDMYSNACKEAVSANNKAKELGEMKIEGTRRLEEAHSAEEAALAMVEAEKAKCRAATEATKAAQMMAELEARKRRSVEMKAKLDTDEKMKALDSLAHNDVRYRKYTIGELEIATEDFADNLKVGEGGYGPVFRGYLDHTSVAIKVLRPDAAHGRRQFNQEVEVLSCIRHPNMVLLLGACPEYGCLVYEYLDNGSLEDRLFRRGNTPPISWPIRFKIAAEIATALLFLHQTKPEPLVHRDLKPANILLDRNYVSKISDVGLARLVPPSVANKVTQYHMTAAAGTFCYIDPEYQQTGLLGCKSDIYSLGVLLLQIVTGRPPMGLTHHVERAIEKGIFEEVLDPTVKDWPVEECLGYANLALKCTELRRKDRPDLGSVIVPALNWLRNLGYDYERGISSGCSSFSSDSSSICNSISSGSSSSSICNSISSGSSISEYYQHFGVRGPPGLTRLNGEGPNQHVHSVGSDGPPRSNADILSSYESR